MKILALRGENLASLQAKFEIDFAHGRLGDAGLFAITGRTGAGKSTLLDAICLALFDRIPRLQANKKNDAEIGRGDDVSRLKANDVRSVLSRGKAEGFSEVDFRAHDGSLWRAHWQVRRARGRADGRIQASEQWLENLETGQRFAGKKQELQSEIERLIGLSFDQFRRAVMLPQGEFAAFLKAGADDRATLLERMTGGEIYSQLSIAAHERAREEKQALERLHDQLGDIALLSEDDKERLAEQISQLTESNKKAEVALQEAQAHQSQLDQFHQLEKSWQQAITDQQQCQQQRDDADPRLQTLKQVEDVQPAKSDFSQRDKTQQSIQLHQQSIEQLHQNLAQHQQWQQESDLAVNQHRQHLLVLDQQWSELEPKLREAASLDTQREGVSNRITTLTQQHATHQQALQAITSELQVAQQQHHDAQSERTLRLNEQSQYANLAGLTEQLEPILDNLNQYRTAYRQQHDAQQQIEVLKQNQHRQQGERQEITRHQQHITQQKNTLEEQCSQLDVETLEAKQHAQQTEYTQRQQRLDKLGQQLALSQEWQNSELKRQDSYRELDKLQSGLLALQREEAELLPQLDIQRAQLKEAQRSYDQSFETAKLEDYRHLLQEGEPCPLCGAESHPYAESHPVVASLLQQQQVRIGELQTTLQQGDAQHRYLVQQIAHTEQQLPVLSQRISHEVQIQENILSRLQHVVGHEVKSGIWQSEPELWRTEGEALRQNISKLEAEYHQRQLQIQQGKKWLNELAELNQAEQNAQKRYYQLEQEKIQFDERVNSTNATLEYAREVQQSRSLILNQLFGHESWLDLVHHQDQLDAFQAKLQRYAELQQIVINIDTFLSGNAPKLSELGAKLANAQQQMTNLENERTELNEKSNLLWAQRYALVGEKLLSELEQASKSAREVGQSALNASLERYNKLSEAHAGLSNERQLLEKQASEMLLELEVQKQNCQNWLDNMGLSAADLEALLQYSSEWVIQEREFIRSLDQRLTQAVTRVDERHQAYVAQGIKVELLKAWLEMVECEDLELVAAQLRERQHYLQESKKSQDNALYEAKRQWDESIKAEVQAGDLHLKVTQQQQKTELWLKMSELIGSATGNKFRTLAQGLTLQQLVLVANTHLQELAPRYALQPVPGAPLALQVVDHDMGDEVRSVESLSGGESFLLSLSLALALASLAADTRQLGSLFIDEGFGTLDPDSLEMALACLDALQANGRQIGVISHVSTLVERIGVQVSVEALGGGRSQVKVKG